MQSQTNATLKHSREFCAWCREVVRTLLRLMMIENDVMTNDNVWHLIAVLIVGIVMTLFGVVMWQGYTIRSQLVVTGSQIDGVLSDTQRQQQLIEGRLRRIEQEVKGDLQPDVRSLQEDLKKAPTSGSRRSAVSPELLQRLEELTKRVEALERWRLTHEHEKDR